MNGSIHNNVREMFYIHAGMNPSVRWTYNPIPEAAKKERSSCPEGAITLSTMSRNQEDLKLRRNTLIKLLSSPMLQE